MRHVNVQTNSNQIKYLYFEITTFSLVWVPVHYFNVFNMFNALWLFVFEADVTMQRFSHLTVNVIKECTNNFCGGVCQCTLFEKFVFYLPRVKYRFISTLYVISMKKQAHWIYITRVDILQFLTLTQYET